MSFSHSLALGHAKEGWSAEQFEQLVGDLLNADNSLRDVVPQSLLLIISAIPEIAPLSKTLALLITRHVFLAYSQENASLFDYQPLRKTLEQAVANLLESEHKDVVKQVIIEELQARNSPCRMSRAAAMVKAIKLFDKDVAKALIQIYP